MSNTQAHLRVVQRAARRARRREAARAIVEPVQFLPNLAPHAISADECVRVRFGAVRECGADAAAVAQILKSLDARLDADLRPTRAVGGVLERLGRRAARMTPTHVGPYMRGRGAEVFSMLFATSRSEERGRWGER